MFTTGFQSSAFQSAGNATNYLGGGGAVNYHHPYLKYQEEERQRGLIAKHKAQLAAKELELAEAEAAKVLALATEKAAKQRAALEAKLQEGISRLRNERIWLMQRINEEEGILIILMMMRRRRLRVV